MYYVNYTSIKKRFMQMERPQRVSPNLQGCVPLSERVCEHGGPGRGVSGRVAE